MRKYSELKSILVEWYNLPYHLRYNYSLDVLGISPVWIKTFEEIEKILNYRKQYLLTL